MLVFKNDSIAIRAVWLASGDRGQGGGFVGVSDFGAELPTGLGSLENTNDLVCLRLSLLTVNTYRPYQLGAIAAKFNFNVIYDWHSTTTPSVIVKLC